MSRGCESLPQYRGQRSSLARSRYSSVLRSPLAYLSAKIAFARSAGSSVCDAVDRSVPRASQISSVAKSTIIATPHNHIHPPPHPPMCPQPSDVVSAKIIANEVMVYSRFFSARLPSCRPCGIDADRAVAAGPEPKVLTPCPYRAYQLGMLRPITGVGVSSRCGTRGLHRRPVRQAMPMPTGLRPVRRNSW